VFFFLFWFFFGSFCAFFFGCFFFLWVFFLFFLCVREISGNPSCWSHLRPAEAALSDLFLCFCGEVVWKVSEVIILVFPRFLLIFNVVLPAAGPDVLPGIVLLDVLPLVFFCSVGWTIPGLLVLLRLP